MSEPSESPRRKNVGQNSEFEDSSLPRQGSRQDEVCPPRPNPLPRKAGGEGAGSAITAAPRQAGGEGAGSAITAAACQAGGEGVEIAGAAASSNARLNGLDCLRGLMLAIVLADHVDFASGSSSAIRNWTLMGLGFSDAAEGFVFLSGLVFGYVYSQRLRQASIWVGLRTGLKRTLQIYSGFLISSAIVLMIHQHDSSNAWAEVWQNWLASAYLQYQPNNTVILALYVVLLPCLLLLFLLLERTRLGHPGIGR